MQGWMESNELGLFSPVFKHSRRIRFKQAVEWIDVLGFIKVTDMFGPNISFFDKNLDYLLFVPRSQKQNQ